MRLLRQDFIYLSKVKEFTLVDMMVLLDCVANIAIIGVMFLAFPVRVWGDPNLCIIFHFYRVFVVALNREGGHVTDDVKEELQMCPSSK